MLLTYIQVDLAQPDHAPQRGNYIHATQYGNYSQTDYCTPRE